MSSAVKTSLKPWIRAAVGGCAALAVTAAGVVAATPADAAPLARGRVVAQGGLTVRAWPSTDAPDYGRYAKGRVLTLTCKIAGEKVDGNRWWYLVPSEGWTWVSARYVKNLGPAPKECAGGTRHFTARTKISTNVRTGPSTATAKTGRIAGGKHVAVVCELPSGQPVDGNPSWLYLTDGRWVATRNLTVSGTPRGCYA